MRRRRPADSRRLVRPLFPALAAVLALVVLPTAVTASGCGGRTTVGVAHYANARYRFSLDVDRRLTEWRTATTASGAAFEVSFVDAAVTAAGGRHPDALTVSVVDTGTNPSSEEAAQLAASLRTLGAAMVTRMGADALAGTVTDVSLNGLSGVVVPFGVTTAGVRQVGWLYLLAAGGRVYALTAAATADQWETYRPLFTSAIDSFRVG